MGGLWRSAAVGTEGTTEFIALLGMDMALVDMVVGFRYGNSGQARSLHARDGERQAASPIDAALCAFRAQRNGSAYCLQSTASCDQRCCRWLLIAHDNALSDEFPLTHEELAMMLGYQRPGVSISMASLVEAGFIKHTRGKVIVSDRPGLNPHPASVTAKCRANSTNSCRDRKKRHKCSNSHERNRSAPLTFPPTGINGAFASHVSESFSLPEAN